VKSAITADAANWTVTFHLEQPWGPFLHTLVGSWGSIQDKEWVAANGGWDGDCATWQNYYGRYSDQINQTALGSSANGTGPFILEAWNQGVEISLKRNPHYWRSTPMWEGGPSGPAALERVVIKNIEDEATRYAMLIGGEADLASLSAAYNDQLDTQVLLRYPHPDGLEGELVDPEGILKAYPGQISTNSMDLGLTFYIETGGPVNYIGSGELNGYGVPPDFFSDIHVRKAFNYAFNWQAYIGGFLGGKAIQRRGPIPAGMLGYTAAQPVYSYNPALALQEINQAWGGAVSQYGFTLTLAYNTGNLQRRTVLENLKAGVEALNPKFHIQVIELDWPTFLADQRASRLPAFPITWIEDIHHPYNWVQPYMVGVYANRARFPEEIKAVYLEKINACMALSGSAAQACYEDIQNTAYLDAIDIFLAQPYQVDYLRAEVRGYYQNPALWDAYFYPLSKGPLPIVETATPGVQQVIDFNNTGATGSLSLPAGAITQTLEIAVTPDIPVTGGPNGFHLADLAFDIQAYAGGTPLSSLAFNAPATISIHYTYQSTGPLIESELRLFWWNGSQWEDAACGPYVRNPLHDTLQVPVCHFSRFALGGASHDLFLPTLSGR
jgi:peptide/nickel transport system substrate-binding protein